MEDEGIFEGMISTDDEGEYRPVSLPVSAKAAVTWIALQETMISPLPDQTPLGEIIQAIKTAVRGKDTRIPPFEIYLDPWSLRVHKLTMERLIPSPFIGATKVSVYRYLQLLFRGFPMVCNVRDGIVIVEHPCDDCPGYQEVNAPEAWTRLVLHEIVPLSFTKETPFEEVINAIQQATVGKGKDGGGLVIHVDPLALKSSEKTMTSKVTIDLHHAPLCTALNLILDQLELGFRVTNDGVLMISSRENSGEYQMMDDARLGLDYQDLRYSFFHHRKDARSMVDQLRVELLSRFRESFRPRENRPRSESVEPELKEKSNLPEENSRRQPAEVLRQGRGNGGRSLRRVRSEPENFLARQFVGKL